MKSVLTKISAIKRNPNNPRILKDDKFAKLTQSIKDFPQMLDIRPIVVNDDMIVLGGNMRLKACKEAGLKEVPVIKVKDLTEEQQREFIIKDNVGFGEWDWDLLANEWDTDLLEDWGLELDFNPVDDDNAGLTDEDDVPEVTEEPVSKAGDIWLLGEHRVMCGDSTSADDVALLMNGEMADICFTSPPYNAGDNIRGHFYENDNDDKSQDDYTSFLNDFTNIVLNYSDYVFVNIQMLEGNKVSIIDYQHNFKHQMKDILIWNKTQYPPHINKGTFGCKWEYIIAFANDGKSRSFPCEWQGKYPNVIETENNSSNEFADIHKAGFPVSFPYWVIDKMDFAKLIIDPFIGTGTTLIAAEKKNRKCYGMELDPKYVDVIIKRWQEYTGKIATHAETGVCFNEVADAK